MRVGPNNSPVVLFKYGTINRTDVVGVPLFELPAGALPLSIFVWARQLSDAGTTATVSVGDGTNATFFGEANVLADELTVLNGPGIGEVWPETDAQVTAVYAETGAASAVGGPFNVVVLYVMMD